jgi:DNA-binding MarR family transcriptional regulator
MASRKNVQNTHIGEQIRRLHGALVEIVGVFNQPERDDALIEAAGIRLDRALFPLLIGIDRVGPIGVVDLAGKVGRDYTTVSRQVAKLEELGLIERQVSATDRRLREAVATERGRQMARLVDGARERIGREIFETWSQDDVDDLVRLVTRFAEALKTAG